MSEPTWTPSRTSIIASAALAVIALAGAFWIGFAPEDEYTLRHSVGFIFGLVLGVHMVLVAATRLRDRMVAQEMDRRALATKIQHNDIQEANTGRWLHPQTGEVVLTLVYDEAHNTWRAAGYLVRDFEGPRDERGWVTLPDIAYARVAVTEAEDTRWRPSITPGTVAIRTRLGLVWEQDSNA